ncbi:amidohydrolase family protein [Gemmatimonadota bacterium]
MPLSADRSRFVVEPDHSVPGKGLSPPPWTGDISESGPGITASDFTHSEAAMPPPQLLAVARGEQPADLLLRNGHVCNVFTGELEKTEVALAGHLIAGVGEGYEARSVVDLEGRNLLPGFIDAHVHIESSLVTPREFARAVVPRGTTTVVSDPHEIANVHGIAGIQYMLEASKGLPLSVFVMASSCVPATAMGTAGAALDASDLSPLLTHPRVLGLAEVMNFPGVIHGDPGILAKLEAFRGRIVDGHAPGVTGKGLNAYLAAGIAPDDRSLSERAGSRIGQDPVDGREGEDEKKSSEAPGEPGPGLPWVLGNPGVHLAFHTQSSTGWNLSTSTRP